MRTIAAAIVLLLACAVCVGYELDMHAMVVGDKALELIETNPITSKADGEVASACVSPNGRQVVYSVGTGNIDRHGQGDYHERLFIAATDGTRRLELVPPTTAQLTGKELPTDLAEAWVLRLPTSFYSTRGNTSPWAPNSKCIAIEALCFTTRKASKPETIDPSEDTDDDTASMDTWYLVFDTKAKTIGHFRLRDGENASINPVVWSQDSRRFAAVIHQEDGLSDTLTETADTEASLSRTSTAAIFDTSDASRHDLQITTDAGYPFLFGWSGLGTSIVYSGNFASSVELREHPLDGSSERVLVKSFNRLVSPDAKRRIVVADKSLSIEEIATGKTTEILRGEKPARVFWTPNSQFLLCDRDRDMKDFSGRRSVECSELWLVCAEARPLNDLCVSTEADLLYRSASADCLTIAYLCQGRLYIAKLGWREPTCWEKHAAGLKLTEEDTKTILLDRADIIGTAIVSLMTQSEDSDEPAEPSFPDIETLKKEVADYVEIMGEPNQEDFYRRPGERIEAFHYSPPDEIENPEESVVGYMDAGFSWRINIYADGNAELVEKDAQSEDLPQ